MDSSPELKAFEATNISEPKQTSLLESQAPLNQATDTLARLRMKQVLKHSFGFVSMLALSSTVLATWEGVLVLLTSGFTNGGSAGLVYGFLLVWAGSLSTYITIAELASLAPTSGGQYHWVYMLSPPSARNFLSYLTGWLNVLAWQATLATGAFLCGTVIQGLLIPQLPFLYPAAMARHPPLLGHRPRVLHL